MTTANRMIASGILDDDGDSFFLRQPNDFLLLDAPFTIDATMKGKAVSVVGHMGIPASAPGITKLIIDRMVLQADIALRAFAIFKSPSHVSQTEDWFKAERELLGA